MSLTSIVYSPVRLLHISDLLFSRYYRGHHAKGSIQGGLESALRIQFFTPLCISQLYVTAAIPSVSSSFRANPLQRGGSHVGSSHMRGGDLFIHTQQCAGLRVGQLILLSCFSLCRLVPYFAFSSWTPYYIHTFRTTNSPFAL